MAALQAVLNRNMLHSRHRALDVFHSMNMLSGSKGMNRHGHHTAAMLSRTIVQGAKTTTHPIRFAALPQTNGRPLIGTRTFSAIHTPSLLARTSTASFRYGMLKNSSLSSAMRQQKVRHPFTQMTSFHPNIGSIAYFSSQNNNLTPRPPPNQRGLGSLAGMAGTGALVLFGKTKYVLAALKLTKLAPLGSMLLTVGTYSMFFGLPYAAGMVGLILVHEIGHAAVMHYRGVPFSPMVFVPFMGAVIATKKLPRDAWEDALIAFGGPVLGSLGAGAVGLAGHAIDSQLLIALADFGLMINMFNLLPLGSMDGGRIAGALSPYMSVAGVAMGAGLAYTGAIHNPIFYLILLSGGYQTFQRFYNPGAMPPNYYAITPIQRAALGLGYIGLVSSLALAMDLNGRYKKSPEVLMKERELEKTWDMR